MNQTRTKQGVCSVCECAVPLQPSSAALIAEHERGYDDWMINREYGDAINYICVDHTFYGEHCEGSGQIPQVVCKD